MAVLPDDDIARAVLGELGADFGPDRTKLKLRCKHTIQSNTRNN